MKSDRDSFLWIDLKHFSDNALLDLVQHRYCAYSVSECSQIQGAIEEISPRFLCFDFDSPDGEKLAVLKHTKWKNPNLPILMLTESHSEKLAIWAYRIRVWDYLVKPFEVGELGKRIDILLSMRKNVSRRQNYLPTQWVSMDGMPPPKQKSTFPALTYIDANFSQKIRLETLAKLCNMSTYHFCRIFKAENGVTFVDFMAQKRIGAACLMLSSSSVKEAAFAVGFNDPSYFSRVFRRYVGASPKAYCSGKTAG